MITNDFARLMLRACSVLAVTIAIAAVSGAVPVGAQTDRREQKAEKQKDEKDKGDRNRDGRNRDDDDDDLSEDRAGRSRAPGLQMCHVTRNGRAHMTRVRARAEATHRAHGDARPGEPAPRNPGFQFAADCKQVAVQQQPPPPQAPPPPPPVSETPLACPCWNSYTQAQFLNVVSTVPVAESFCVVNENTVSLSPDAGTATLVYATVGSCMLRLNGQDLATIYLQTPEENSQCMSEAATLATSFSWCAQ